jgi:hypothetical protein
MTSLLPAAWCSRSTFAGPIEFGGLQETTGMGPIAAARQRFPGYQDQQRLDALDYVGDGLESAFAGEYTDDQWQSIIEHLAEHVQNGLE